MKYLYIRLEVQDGEREHTHHCLHITKAENIIFAAERYAASFWGKSTHDEDGKWHTEGDQMIIEYKKVEELTKKQYNFLNSLFY